MQCPSCGQSVKGVAFWVDAEAHAICLDDKHIQFTPAEFKVFNLLYSHVPNRVSKYQFYVALWDGDEPEQADNNVKVYLVALRKKLAGTRFKIENIWGEGERMVVRHEDNR